MDNQLQWQEDENHVITEFRKIDDRLYVSRDGEFLVRGKRRFGTTRAGGYLGITWKGTTVYAHRAVYTAWVGAIPLGYEIDHLDCDKTNNAVENLRLVTRSENMRNPKTRVANLRQLASVRGRAHAARIRAVLSIDACQRITRYTSVTEASKATGACRSDIARAAHGKRQHAAGFGWRYCK